jgi:hypothetical protein
MKRITKLATTVSVVVLMAHSSMSLAGIRFDGPNDYFEKDTERKERTSVILSGSDAEELYDLLPAMKHEWIDGNPESMMTAAGTYVSKGKGELCFGKRSSFPLNPGNGGHPGSGVGFNCSEPWFVYESKWLVTDLNRRERTASPLICFKGANETFCRINIPFSAANPDLPEFNSPIPFDNSKANSNNHLGRTLKGETFQTADGKLELFCETLAVNRYYDCFVTLW